MSKRILIVEDEKAIADNLVLAFQLEGFESVRTETGTEGLRKLQEEIFDLVVLDVGLPDMSGFEVCKRIRLRSAMPIFFLTARSDEIDRVVGLEIGADDYILKPFSPREVVARIKAIFRRAENSFPAQEAEPAVKVLPFSIDETRRKIRFHQTELDLSPIEYALLKVLMSRPGMVFSRGQLLERISDEPAMSLERTVDSHIKSIRAKIKTLSQGSDEEWIETHRGFGYAFRKSGAN